MNDDLALRRPKAFEIRDPCVLWLLSKAGRRLHAELTDRGAGFHFNIFRNGELLYGHRYDSREDTIEDAESCRREFEAEGWRRSSGIAS